MYLRAIRDPNPAREWGSSGSMTWGDTAIVICNQGTLLRCRERRCLSPPKKSKWSKIGPTWISALLSCGQKLMFVEPFALLVSWMMRCLPNWSERPTGGKKRCFCTLVAARGQGWVNGVEIQLPRTLRWAYKLVFVFALVWVKGVETRLPLASGWALKFARRVENIKGCDGWPWMSMLKQSNKL